MPYSTDLPSTLRGPPSCAPVDGHAAPAAHGHLPLQVGQLHFAAGADQARLAPIDPIGGNAVASVGHDQEQLLGALDVGVDVNGVARGALGDLFAGEDGLGRLGGARLGRGIAFGAASPAGKPIFLRIASRSRSAGIGSSWLIDQFVERHRLVADAAGRNLDFSGPEDRVQHQLAEVGLAPIPMIVTTGETEAAPAADIFRRPGNMLRFLLFQTRRGARRDCRCAGRRDAKAYRPEEGR